MKNQQLIAASSNAPHDLDVCVSLNGVVLTPAKAVEVKDGALVIACDAPAPKGDMPKLTSKAAVKMVGEVDSLAKVLVDEFGGPTKSESACEMAVRVLREQRSQIEQLTAPPKPTAETKGGETIEFAGGDKA